MVSIKDSQRLLRINKIKLKKIIEDLVASLGLQGRNLSILFVDNEKIRGLNQRYFGRDRATNVISFSYIEDQEHLMKEEVIGDIIISIEKARDEAEIAQCDFYERLIALIIHGLLHIIGFDHEMVKKDARRMRYQEKKLLRYVKEHRLYDRLGTPIKIEG